MYILQTAWLFIKLTPLLLRSKFVIFSNILTYQYMAYVGDDENWNGDERLYSNSSNDESPLLSYRHDRYKRFAPYVREIKTEERDKRSTLTILAKCILFCSTMISLCMLLYIPVYYKANDQLPKAIVAGWSAKTSRDTKLYVQPKNITTLHEPSSICCSSCSNISKQNKLFLLVVVCSATEHFERRIAIRETWGNITKYHELSKLFNKARDDYKKYNYTYDLYKENDSGFNITDVFKRMKREISGFSHLLPALAKALQVNMVTADTRETRFDDEMLPEFDMNKELGDQTESYDYVYDSNVMKIPPNGYEELPDLDKILSLLKNDKNFPKIPDIPRADNAEVDFKLTFLLGLPASGNVSRVQGKIDEEVAKYGDIIQENFLDSYNNLTLKSIMMLKWVTNKCIDSARYILKTDDDMYINMPYLISNLRNRSSEHDKLAALGYSKKEHLLIGDLICGARPVQDSNNKWYSPRYMYGGRVYPRYLSGTGYALTTHTAAVLYTAALRTPYFHLEDIYITGICAARGSPRIVPREDPAFSYSPIPDSLSDSRAACTAHAHVTTHRVTPARMRAVHTLLRDDRLVDECERIRLTQVRKDMIRQKIKLLKKHAIHKHVKL